MAAAISLACFTSLTPPLARAQRAGQQVILGVECSRVYELGIDRQLNLRAGMIMVGCGLAGGGQPGQVSSSGPGQLGPPDTTSVDVITGSAAGAGVAYRLSLPPAAAR
jgi:hypothetical protein